MTFWGMLPATLMFRCCPDDHLNTAICVTRPFLFRQLPKAFVGKVPESNCNVSAEQSVAASCRRQCPTSGTCWAWMWEQQPELPPQHTSKESLCSQQLQKLLLLWHPRLRQSCRNGTSLRNYCWSVWDCLHPLHEARLLLSVHKGACPAPSGTPLYQGEVLS